MTNRGFIIVLLTLLAGVLSCSDKTQKDEPEGQTNAKQMIATTATLKAISEAFNRHDLDAIMEFFSDDCTLDFPRGPEAWGQRFIGKAQVREGLACRFKGIPDVHYGDDSHWVSADGNKGVSEWTLTGTTVAGIPVKVRGCDLWEFRDGKITRKNSFWKIVEPANQPASK